MRLRILILIVLASGFGAPLSAQSLFNAAGMGLPVEALDGRARALGNLGIGLGGASLMPTDPGAAGRFVLATGVMAGQPSWVNFSSPAGGGRFRGTRFPLLGVAYPILSGIASVQMGSFLDQRFQSETTGSVMVAGEPLATRDLFVQDGSVSNITLGFAKQVGGNTSVGVTVGRYAGSVVRAFKRSFGDGTSGVQEYVSDGTWHYTGKSVTAGVSADIRTGVRVAASVQIPSALEAIASETTDGGDGEFDLPVQYRLGATATLAPGLIVNGSVALADWSGAAAGLEGTGVAGNTNGFGLGVELSRARLLGKEAPLRFGFRRTGLPFSFDDQAATERIFSGGFGIALNRTNDVVLAGADFALERGRRSGAGIQEDFWRATISLVLSGF